MNQKKYSLFSHIAFLFFIGSLGAFEPASMHDTSQMIYVELSPLKESIKNVKDFSKALMGAQAESYLKMISEEKKNEYSIDPLDPKSLEKNGFNISESISISANIKKENNEDLNEFKIIIPAKNSARLYAFVKRFLQKSIDERKKKKQRNNQNDNTNSNDEGEALTEIKKGRLLQAKDKNSTMYVGRLSKSVIITNQANPLSHVKNLSSNTVARSDYYAKLKTHFLKENNGKLPEIAVYLNPEAMSKMYDKQGQGMIISALLGSMAKFESLSKEIQENILGGGGFLRTSGKGAQLHFANIYKDGYLQDPNSTYGLLLSGNHETLSPDYFASIPVLLLSFRINFMETMKLIKNLSEDIRQDLQEADADFKADTNLSLEKDIFPAISGTMTLLVTDIPEEKELKSPEKWKGVASIGINPEYRDRMTKLFDVVQKEMEKKQDPEKAKLKKNSYGSSTLYTLEVPSNTDEDTKSKMTKPTKLYIMLSEKEMMFGFDLKQIKAFEKLPVKGTTIQNRLSKKKINEKINTYLYVNLSTIVEYIRNSSLAPFAMAYMPFLENLDNLHVLSTTKENYATGDFILDLKKK